MLNNLPNQENCLCSVYFLDRPVRNFGMDMVKQIMADLNLRLPIELPQSGIICLGQALWKSLQTIH